MSEEQELKKGSTLILTLAVWFRWFDIASCRLPAEDRAELHAELRQHLDSLTGAHEELGSSPEEAWLLALAQFGDPAQIGRKMYQEWQQSRTARAGNAASAHGALRWC